MPVINGVYTKDFPALGRAPIDTDIIPIAEVANQITYKTTIGEIFNAKVFGTAGAIPKFTSANTLGDSIITELSDKIGIDIATPNNKLSINSTDPGSGLDLQIGATSYARFGIINPGIPGEPGVDNDCFIGSTINNDFLVRTNNIEALRIDTAQRLTIANIQNALADTDKFLVSEGGVVKYRTGAEVLADIGGASATGFVPYTGATTDVDLGTHSLLAESITLDSTPATLPTAQGSMYFDEDEQTLAVILNGTTQMVGEDVFFQIKNQTGVTIPKGTAVRFDGVVGSSGRLLAVPFLADGTYSSLYFLGVTSEDILEGGDGKAYITGKVNKLNTNAYAIGTILYCSTTVAGGFQTTPPIAPNNIISVAAVIAQSATVGKILVRPQLGSNINNDEGVKIVSGVTGDLLQLQASGLWENKTVSTVMSNYVTLDTTQTITGAKTFSSDIAVNGVQIGRGGGTIGSNTRVGSGALSNNTIGYANTAFGQSSLLNNTGGYYNTAIGINALASNTTGYNNTANGSNALLSNTTGNNNEANGNNSLYSNTSGYYNVANGSLSLYSNTTGNSNIAIGQQSLLNNTTGYANVGLGVSAGNLNTTGVNNIFLGSNSTGESITESNRTWIGNTDTTSTWLGGNLLLGSRNNATSDKLQITGGAKITGIITLGTGADSYVYDSSGSLILQTGASARLTIAPSGAATFASSVKVNGTPAATSGILSVVTSTSTLGATADLGLLISNGGSVGQLSQIGFGYSESRSAAVIGGIISNGAGSTTSDLFFATRTTTTGSDAPTERMRITSGGNVGIGTTSPATKLEVIANANTFQMARLENTNNTSGNGVLVTSLGSNCNNTSSYHLIAGTGGADKFYLYGNGTYTTVSDSRLKKDINKVTDNYLDKVLALNIVNYHWNDQNENDALEFGMIAQEVEELIPSIVHEGREDENGNKYKGIQASVLPYILIKAIQEQQAQIEELKALINK